ncbi:MAG: (d)CMP kinase [Clostridia bacterium]|jgi:cytidylate kinase|nr:(d)CMP kinase [Clostridia bacterium]
MIVAVDGPAGSGKGTVTKMIEKELGFLNLDTGATYRCVALEALRRGLTLQDEEQIIEVANKIDIKINNVGDKDIVLLNDEDVTEKIRTKEVTAIVSQISSIVPVREKMVEVQRKLAIGKDVIVEGRDIGTVVFPNAEVKIYLDASEEVRAKRRYEENLQKGINTTYEEVLENVKMRDYNDMHKKVGALKKTQDSIVIDSTDLTIDEVVKKIENIICEKS